MIRLEEETPKVDLSVFLDEVRLMAPGCPEEIIASYVRQAAIEAADRSLLLKRTGQILWQAGVRLYPLEADDCTRIVNIDWICDYRGRRHYPKPNAPCVLPCERICNPMYANAVADVQLDWRWATFRQPNELELGFTPLCDVAPGLSVRFSVAPTRDACEIDALLYEKYAQDIHKGAAQWLLAMPNQPWTNVAMAGKYERDWMRSLTKFSTDALLQESRGPFQATAQRIV